MNKRVTGYVSWKRHRRSVHDPSVLVALNADLQALAPDHTVVTGDLTNLALPAEFDRAITWLADLGSPEQVSVIPGNHDAYIEMPWSETFGRLAPYMAQGEQRAEMEVSPFPFVRKIDKIAIVGVSSAVPTRWFSAAGKVGQAQLARLKTMLRELGEDGFFRAVLVHHPPINGSARVPKQLRDGAGFRKVIADAGAELVLHGHNHRFDQGETKTPLGSAPVIGVPSASARPKNGSRAAAYHIYRINPANNGWHIQMDIRRFDRHSECFVADRRHHFSVPAALVTASAA